MKIISEIPPAVFHDLLYKEITIRNPAGYSFNENTFTLFQDYLQGYRWEYFKFSQAIL